MIIWCTMLVLMKYGNEVIPVETAVRGKLINGEYIHYSSYFADFSEYAKKQGYIGSFEKRVIKKDDCIKE